MFGEGNINTKLMFIGEAPGANEDKHGRPFCGRSGDLLDLCLKKYGVDRKDVYITNMAKCRPPGNRNPTPYEMEKCKRFLKKQILLIRPEVIITLGSVASKAVLKDERTISDIRGLLFHREMPYGDCYIIPTFHPAYLLRNPLKKTDLFEDVLKGLNIIRHG